MLKMNLKRILTLCIAILMVVMSTVCAFATDVSDRAQTEPDIEFLDDKYILANNNIYFTTYNISKNNNWGVQLRYNDDKDRITVMAKDCIDAPQKLKVEKGIVYSLFIYSKDGAGGGSGYSCDTTGGVHKKVRVKLSDVSTYFNEDGSHTSTAINFDGGHTYYFGDDEYVDKNMFSSGLFILSGGCISFVAPDKDGYVEFYVSTDIDKGPIFFTDFTHKIHKDDGIWSGSGGGINGGNIKYLTMGAVKGSSYVSVTDATEIQRYISKLTDLDRLQKYRADVDLDGRIDVLDATKIQRYLAKLEE